MSSFEITKPMVMATKRIWANENNMQFWGRDYQDVEAAANFWCDWFMHTHLRGVDPQGKMDNLQKREIMLIARAFRQAANADRRIDNRLGWKDVPADDKRMLISIIGQLIPMSLKMANVEELVIPKEIASRPGGLRGAMFQPRGISMAA